MSDLNIQPFLNHVGRISRLIEQYSGKPLLEGLLKSYLQQVQDLENAVFEVILERLLENAVGVQLAHIGAIVGQPRFTANDAEYKLMIRVRIALNKSDGAPEQLMKMTRLMLVAAERFRFDEEPPYQERVTVLDAIQENPLLIEQMLKSGKDGGVRILLSYSDHAESDGFVLADHGGGAVTGKGLGSSRLLALSIVPSSVWPLDEVAGAVAVDAAGLYNGAHTSVTVNQAGQINKAAAYTASPSYTDCGDAYSFERTQPFSVSCWFKINGNGFDKSLVCHVDPAGSVDRGWALNFDTQWLAGSVSFQLISTYGANWIYVSSSANGLGDDAWHHVVVTYDGSSAAAGVKIYVDGSITVPTVHGNTLSATTVAANRHLMFGSRGVPGNVAVGLTGRLDDVAVFSGVLTAQDVATIYAFGIAAGSVAGALPITVGGQLAAVAA